MKKFKTVFITIFILIISIKIFPASPENDETIILPSTYGWIDDGEINISAHAWIFKLKEGSYLRSKFIDSLKDYFENAGSDEKINLEQRVKYFTADNKRGRNIRVSVNGINYDLPGTAPNGHTFSLIKIRNNSKYTTENIRSTISTLPGGNTDKIFSGTVSIISKKGYSIISDIDDTIKISNVLDKKELINNTFLRKFTPVTGMPELYRNLEKKGFTFHYLSGSPWQLYPAIDKFLHDEQFPEGSVELKLFRMKDRSLINFLTADQLPYKISAIKILLDRFPERKFILIGDSGEKDPEVYSEIAHQYKNRIKYIFIRDAGLIEGNQIRLKSIQDKAGSVKIVIFKNVEELKKYTDGF